MGTLKVKGTLDLNQIWFNGTSDADTLKVTIGKEAFTFAADDKNFIPTGVFYNSLVRAQSGTNAVISSKSQIDVRLEGIDAPELHYKIYGAPPKGKLTDEQYKLLNAANRDEYSQYLARTAAVEMYNYLLKLSKGKNIVDCEVVTENVKVPGDVCDNNARLVSMIFVKKKNINYWLAKNGWVFPGFYTSTTEPDKAAIKKAVLAARKKKLGIWKFYSAQLQPVDFLQMVKYTHGDKTYDMIKDAGKVIFPKLFRRLVTYRIHTTAGIEQRSFTDYLIQGSDRLIINGKKQKWDKVISNDAISALTEELIFVENAADLVDAGGNKITKWF